MTAEILSADKWEELKGTEPTVPIPPAGDTIAVVVRDDDGSIVARGYLLFPTTLQGVWVREDKRGTTAGAVLFGKIEQKVHDLGAKMLLACIKRGSVFEDYARRVGFKRAPWEHWKKEY